MDTLSEMAVFARVVQFRSFTAAAKDLGLSKSAVSKQVSRLEDRLGARLLNRTTRRLSLTEVGEAFYERCARIVDEARAAEAEAMNLADAPRGVLRINAPMTFGTQHLAPAIPAFLDLYPDIEMDLVLDDRIVDLIAEGFDAGVRITSMADSSLVARRIAPSRHIVCAAPAYLEKHGRPTVPDDLRDHNCLGYSYRARGADWTVIGPDGPVSVPVRGGLRTNNGDVLRTAALAGLGIVAAPTFNVGDDLRSGRLVALFEEAAPATHAIYAVYPHRRHVLPKVRAFVDFLAARLGPEPYWDR
jgi:DNA-binding transcriptional LysR family regulator